MSIEPKLTGWQSIKSKLIAVIRIANQVRNARITRSGSQDSISFSGNSMVINLKQFPKAKAGGVGGGAEGLTGIEIVWADQTTSFIRASDFFVGYDPDPSGANDLYWSAVFTVSGGVFDKTVTYDEKSDIFEDDGGTPATQTKYRLRLITQGLDADNNAENTAISVYGQYREVTTCINGEPFQRLTKTT